MAYSTGKILHHRYEIIRPLGEGATSTVYLVRDKKEVGSMWALKQLTHSPDPDDRESLFREIKFLTTLSHPNLIRLIDYFFEDGWDFMVMERIMGPTLEDILEQLGHPLEETDAVEYALAVVKALCYLHGQDPPVVYRDLKPSNIMISTEGDVKLIDLGIARHFNPKKSKDTTALGTPGYCPPEQYGRGQTTPRSDVYSLGATLYQALTLEDPASFAFDFPPVTRFNPDITPALEEILSRCLQNNPDHRFESAHILYDYLTAHHSKLLTEKRTFTGTIRFHFKRIHRRVTRYLTQLLSPRLMKRRLTPNPAPTTPQSPIPTCDTGSPPTPDKTVRTTRKM